MHTTLDNEFLRYSSKSTDHPHLPNLAESEIRNLRENMRERAEKEFLPLQEIAEQVVLKGLLMGEALGVLPGVTNVSHSLVYTRRKTTPALPQSSTVGIPDAYTMDYRNNERLLLHDSHDPKYQSDESGHIRSTGRVLMWSSDTQLNLLFGSEKLHMNGTFRSSPAIFEQVFIIQAILHGACLPVVYALLPDRKAVTYVHLLSVLSEEARRRGKYFAPSLIMTNFEPGIAKAIIVEFSEKTTRKGCHFHFS